MITADENLLTLVRNESSPLEPIPTGADRSTTSMAGIRHIAFDVYGTLLVSGVGDIGNSVPTDRGEALVQFLAQQGVANGLDPSEIDALYLGEIRRSQDESRSRGAMQPEVDIREVWRAFLDRLQPGTRIPDEQIAEIALRFELQVNPVWPMPDLTETLESLADKFAPFSIVSNAQFFTPLLFPALTGKTLPALRFQESSCIWSYELREAKPSLRLFEVLIERLQTNFRPAEILYVGNDMLNDISAAQKAGLRTALFAGDQRSLRLRQDHPECRGVTPDLVLSRLSDLPELV